MESRATGYRPLIKVCKMIVMGSFIVGCTAYAKQDAELEFNQHELQAPFTLTHAILPADILPTLGKELIVFGINERNERLMGIYAFNVETSKYQINQQHVLPVDYHSFDLSESKDDLLQRLYFQSSRHLVRFFADKPTSAFVEVMKIDSMLLATRPDFISRQDFVKDVNGDQRDDIVISDFSQTHLLLSKEDGGFEPYVLPITPQIQMTKGGVSYTQTPIFLADLNMNGRQDVVTIGEGELQVFHQLAEGGFDPVAHYIPVRQAISGVDWWNKRDAYGEQLDQSNLTYRKVEALKDINDDGITDLVLRYTKSSGVLDRVNDYEVFLGQQQQGKLVFPKKPSSIVSAEGTLTGLEFIDIDSDARDEVLVAGFDIGLSQIIGALVSGNIDQDVHLFKMDEQGHFAKQSNISKAVELSFSLSSGQTGSPVVKLADVNGDGRKDLLLSDGLESLRVYIGKPNKRLFSQHAQAFSLQLPQDGDMLICDDLNGDGKDDVLIKYGRQDEKKLHSRFKVVFSG